MNCSVQDCKNAKIARGWCSKHYYRWKRHGSPEENTRRDEGTGSVNKGYILIQKDGKRKFEHILIAEKVLGKPLPQGAVVHHVNGKRDDNSLANLVICQDENYHKLLHARTRAIKNGFPPHYRSCPYCKKFDEISNLKVTIQNKYFHESCRKAYDKIRSQIRRKTS